MNKEAREAFERAMALLKAGKPDEALAVPMLPSDRKVIEKRIAASANRNDTRRLK